ncbi:MAG: hypothetical protein H0V76_11755 [Blastocatellia bacterium]|nr:hypothetical protein [Blastocatellia bacterium]
MNDETQNIAGSTDAEADQPTLASPESNSELDELRHEIEELKTAISRSQYTAPPPPASIDAGAGSGRTPGYLTAESLSRMTAAEIAKLDWEEVRTVLANGQ